jgi:lactoylglutathione lyase
MKCLHTMIRVADVEKLLNFYRKGLSLIETRRMENE